MCDLAHSELPGYSYNLNHSISLILLFGISLRDRTQYLEQIFNPGIFGVFLPRRKLAAQQSSLGDAGTKFDC